MDDIMTKIDRNRKIIPYNLTITLQFTRLHFNSHYYNLNPYIVP